MLSLREKNIRASVDLMFQGLDDDVLKNIILYTALEKSEEEKDKLCEEIKKAKEEDLKYYYEKFEVKVDNETPEEILKLINPEIKIDANGNVITHLEKSSDNIETNGEN